MIIRLLQIIAFVLTINTANAFDKSIIQNGDLLFSMGIGSEFEEAIVSSTANIEDLNFSHVGVVYVEDCSIFVLEATPERGVVMTPIDTFINNSSIIAVARLKHEYQYVIADAIGSIKSLMGKKYDFLYLPNNDDYYCSELIQATFKQSNGEFIFETIPMTFKDKVTGESLVFWVEHYEKHNAKIPENEQGTNPVQLSKSNKIEIIKIFVTKYVNE